MKCLCGGIIEAGTCCDCGSAGLLPVGEIIRALRAHRRAGNVDVLQRVQDEFCEPEEIVIEKIVPIETVVYKNIEDCSFPVTNLYKQGKPPKVTAELLVRVRSMMTNGVSVSEAAKTIGVTKRTLEDYVWADGSFKEAGMKRLRGESRCVRMRPREKA